MLLKKKQTNKHVTDLSTDFVHGFVHVFLTVLQHFYDCVFCVCGLWERGDQALQDWRLVDKVPKIKLENGAGWRQMESVVQCQGRLTGVATSISLKSEICGSFAAAFTGSCAASSLFWRSDTVHVVTCQEELYFCVHDVDSRTISALTCSDGSSNHSK